MWLSACQPSQVYIQGGQPVLWPVKPSSAEPGPVRDGSNVLCDTFSLECTNVVATHGHSTTSNLGKVVVSRSQNQLTYIFPMDTECLRVFKKIISIHLKARHDLQDELALILEFGNVILIPSPARSKNEHGWRD